MVATRSLVLLLAPLLTGAAAAAAGPAAASPVRGASYNETLAMRCLVWSSIAYGPPDDVAASVIYNDSCRALTPSFRVVQTYRDAGRDSFGYIGVDTVERLVVASFKGSNETEDYITDLDGPFRYRAACRVGGAEDGGEGDGVSIGNTHRGFCVYYRSLEALGLTQDLVALWKQHPGYQILVTGHSLGGATATLCAADLGTRFGLLPLLYTFGEPRAGDVAFAESIPYFTAGAFRVVHRSDCVPHLPPCCDGLLSGQCMARNECPYHHGEEIWYESDMPSLIAAAAGEPTDDQDTPPFVLCPGDEDESACTNGDITSVPDHRVYFGVHVGAVCSYPPGTFPDPQRSAAWQPKKERGVGGGEQAAGTVATTAVA